MSAPLTFVPTSSSSSSAGPSVSLSTTSNAIGLHDALRHGGHRSLAAEIQVDPFEQRLKNWEATQTSLRLQMARNAYGLGLPLVQLTERQLVRSSDHPGLAAFSLGGFQMDILAGKDTSLDVEHFFNSGESSHLDADNFHSQMERKARI